MTTTEPVPAPRYRASAPTPSPAGDTVTEPVGPPGAAPVLTVVRPRHARGRLPVVVYTPGSPGAAVPGAAPAGPGRVVHDLALDTGAAVVVVGYTAAPEDAYPVALQQVRAATTWVRRHGPARDLDGARLAVAGDSVGAGMTAAVSLLGLRCADAPPLAQVLLCPVTAAFGPDSYAAFEHGYHLVDGGRSWEWGGQVRPEAEIPVSVRQAAPEDVAALPATLVVTAGDDPLRHEGEEYAAALGRAGALVTAVRYQGVPHGFVTRPGLCDSPAARAAVAQAARHLREVLHPWG
ncbi:alpha/beta hydrolase [Kineococcus sp. NUM-3379]